MKTPSKRLKRSLVLALIACVVLSTGALAVGRLSSWIGGSSATPAYTTFPTAAQLERDLGFVPKLRESFSNGYAFQTAHLGEMEGLDEDGHALGTVKNLSMDYGKDDALVSVFVEDKVLDNLSDYGAPTATVQGVRLYYTAYANKFVPADYMMTEQDKQDEENGVYVFSFGSDRVEVVQVQSVAWDMDGHRYSILGMDSGLTQVELLQMAEELLALD